MMQILWGLGSVFLLLIAQALLRMAFHFAKKRQWEAFLANAVLGLMLTGSAVFLGFQALGL